MTTMRNNARTMAFANAVEDVVQFNLRHRTKPPFQHAAVRLEICEGDSLLLDEIHDRLQQDPTLRQEWIPVRGGDAWGGCSTYVGLLSALSEAMDSYPGRPDWADLGSLVAAARRTARGDDLEKLLEDLLFAKTRANGAAVFLVTRLDRLLDSVSSRRDLFAFRRFLQMSSIVLIGTVRPGFRPDYVHPFYEFFPVTDVEGLDSESVAELCDQAKVDRDETQHILDLAMLVHGRREFILGAIEALGTHPGGTLRQIIHRVVSRGLPEAHVLLDRIPAQTRLVLTTCLGLDPPWRSRDIATQALVPVGAVTTHLRRLESMGLMRASGKSPQRWTISDPAFELFLRCMEHGVGPRFEDWLTRRLQEARRLDAVA